MAFTTRKTLLMKVREGDEVSWAEFYRVYRPLIVIRGRQDRHLMPHELNDLVQRVMEEVFEKDLLAAYGQDDSAKKNVQFKYDSKKGRFRDYMRGIIDNQARNIIRARKPHADMDVEAIEAVAAEDGLEKEWENEWRNLVMNQALEELRNHVSNKHYVAFDMVALQERKAEEVADILGVTKAQVYIIKHRCLEKLRKIIAEIESR